MDNLTSERRSKIMASVRNKNTVPELRVRKKLHALGFRFRLHREDLPGKPDVVLPKYRTCIFVHGCFWHQHLGCNRATLPKSNRKFWRNKLLNNRRRDEKVQRKLQDLGWQVQVIWECHTKSESNINKAVEQCILSRRL